MPLFRRKSRGEHGRPSPSSSNSKRDLPDEVTSIRAGRRYRDDVPYLLPKDLGETNRLDLQHHIMHHMLKSNYVAPIDEPKRILDVGCGTGRWAYEMAKEFPAAEVTALDLEEVDRPQERLPNYQFIVGNLFEDLPFEENHFDFVHQRFLIAAIKDVMWPHDVKELVRVTKPGGLIETVEGGLSLLRGGPLYYDTIGMVKPFIEQSGMTVSTNPPPLEQYLDDAGAVNIKTTSIELPVGNWGGKLGGLLAADVRSAMITLKSLSVSLAQIEVEDFDTLMEKIVAEWEEYHTVYPIQIVYGQKPT